MNRWRGLGSLRLRLLALTVVSLALALLGAGWWLQRLFHEEVMREFDAALVRQLDQVTARLQIDTDGTPRLDARALSDPRLDTPYAGLYWQLDQLDADGHSRRGVLRSRSLWDQELVLAVDALPDGQLHRHEIAGPREAALHVIERALQIEGAPGRWRLLVAADLGPTQQAVQRFSHELTLSLTALGLLLALAAVAQVAIGLSPLQAMLRALTRVRNGQTSRLEGHFPVEVQPLIDELHAVLDRQEATLARARSQAGNLAHALKTPLTVLGNAADQALHNPMSATVTEQVRVARQHIDWHLTRARVAATSRLPGQRTAIAPTVASLIRVMEKVHAERALQWHTDIPDPTLAFAGEAQDLQEMLGNLLDNAGRAARHGVQVKAQRLSDRQLLIQVQDDGPGIADGLRATVLQRGTRLDESTPGSGLGLAIVAELAALYGGSVSLDTAASGGLSAGLVLPAVAT